MLAGFWCFSTLKSCFSDVKLHGCNYKLCHHLKIWKSNFLLVLNTSEWSISWLYSDFSIHVVIHLWPIMHIVVNNQPCPAVHIFRFLSVVPSSGKHYFCPWISYYICIKWSWDSMSVNEWGSVDFALYSFYVRGNEMYVHFLMWF